MSADITQVIVSLVTHTVHIYVYVADIVTVFDLSSATRYLIYGFSQCRTNV